MQKQLLLATALALTSVLVPAGAANAHVTLETKEAATSSYYKAVLRIPHGCSGSPTLKVRVQIPEGVVNVKPQPKAGWQVETVIAPYATPIAGDHGAQIKEGVREIIWTGKLLDEHYEEFAFRSQLPGQVPAGGMLYFPTVQECEAGFARWIEIPADGKTADDYQSPAPGLKLMPKK